MIDTRKIIVGIMYVALCGVLGYFGRPKSSPTPTPFPTPPTPTPPTPIVG